MTTTTANITTTIAEKIAAEAFWQLGGKGKITENRWGGADITWPGGDLMRITLENERIEVFYFESAKAQILDHDAYFDLRTPPSAVAAYALALLVEQ